MKLFYDDEYEAIRSVIEGGKGYKPSASYLWPSMKPDSAYAKLKVCCNSEGDQKLTFGQVIALCKFNGCNDALMFFCDEVHHDRPAARSPADKQAQLMVAFVAAVADVKEIGAQLEKFGGLP